MLFSSPKTGVFWVTETQLINNTGIFNYSNAVAAMKTLMSAAQTFAAIHEKNKEKVLRN